MFKKMDPVQEARKELYETNLAILSAERSLEYAKSQVALYMSRKERLEQYVLDNPPSILPSQSFMSRISFKK